MRAAALVALALLPFLGAEPARAATAGLESGELRYDAAPGEVNQIALSYSWTDYLFTVRDADGVVVTPGAGCVQGTSPNEVVCEDFGRDPVLRAGDGDDTIAVTGVAAKLHGDAGADMLAGGAGNDLLDGGTGADTVAGGAGYDRLDYSLRAAPLLVTPDGLAPDDGEAGEGDRVAADVEYVLGGSAQDDLTVSAAGGRLEGRNGDDELRGGLGLDLLYGGNGSDTVGGGAGADTLDGSAGDDDLSGGDGVDRLSDGLGTDLVSGGGGDDRLIAGSGADHLRGGPGYDHVDYTARLAPLVITLEGRAGEVGEGDVLDPDIEGARGGGGADTITGSAASDYLAGYGGNDVIDGLGGIDAISAGSGNDRVSARDGVADQVSCGSGDDVVQADLGDLVQTDCESIQRPMAPSAPAPSAPAPSAPTPSAPPPVPAAPTPAPAPIAPTLAAPRPVAAPSPKAKAPRAPDTTPPVVSVARDVAGHGHASLPISVRCPESELDGCSGYVTLFTRAGGRRVKVGVSSFNVFGGRRAVVRIGLTKVGRTQARARRRIEAVVAVRDGAGNSHRVSVKLRLLRSQVD